MVFRLSTPFLRIFSQERSCIIKGYDTPAGYMGYVDGKYILFCSEDEYLDYMRELRDAA